MPSYADLPSEIRLQIQQSYFTCTRIRYFPTSPSADLRTHKQPNPLTHKPFKANGRNIGLLSPLLLASRDYRDEIHEAAINYSVINVVGALDMYELTFNCPLVVQQQIRKVALINADAPYELAVAFFAALVNVVEVTLCVKGVGMGNPIEGLAAWAAGSGHRLVYGMEQPCNAVHWGLAERFPLAIEGDLVKYEWVGDVMSGEMFEGKKSPLVEVEVLEGFELSPRWAGPGDDGNKAYWLAGRMNMKDWVLRYEKHGQSYEFEQRKFGLKNEHRRGGNQEEYMTRLTPMKCERWGYYY